MTINRLKITLFFFFLILEIIFLKVIIEISRLSVLFIFVFTLVNGRPHDGHTSYTYPLTTHLLHCCNGFRIKNWILVKLDLNSIRINRRVVTWRLSKGWEFRESFFFFLGRMWKKIFFDFFSKTLSAVCAFRYTRTTSSVRDDREYRGI